MGSLTWLVESVPFRKSRLELPGQKPAQGLPCRTLLKPSFQCYRAESPTAQFIPSLLAWHLPSPVAFQPASEDERGAAGDGGRAARTPGGAEFVARQRDGTRTANTHLRRVRPHRLPDHLLVGFLEIPCCSSASQISTASLPSPHLPLDSGQEGRLTAEQKQLVVSDEENARQGYKSQCLASRPEPNCRSSRTKTALRQH